MRDIPKNAYATLVVRWSSINWMICAAEYLLEHVSMIDPATAPRIKELRELRSAIEEVTSALYANCADVPQQSMRANPDLKPRSFWQRWLRR